MDLQAKVAYLSRPDSYPENPRAVEAVQTHMAWVFLTDRHAYKLKKPVRYSFLDFGTLEARRFDCEEEVRLNRRLARDVYLGVVPLTLAPGAGLRLGGDGEPVEWLVKMRRLPRELMLDQAIARGQIGEDDIRRFTRVLADFYRRARPIAIDPSAYRQRFVRAVGVNHRVLSSAGYGIDADVLQPITAMQLAFAERDARILEWRVAERRIVEGHGDLRPEHVCLGQAPAFIDCLEFNRALRILDPADELAFLAMECECAGAAFVGEVVFDAYREALGDAPPPRLVRFYKAYRATLRARLAVWHIDDCGAERARWIERARTYLALAASHCAAL